MIDFLIKSSICLSVFLCFYHLILEREKTHQFNRFYLLLSIVISFALPFMKFEIIKIIPAVQQTETFPMIPVAFETVTETIDYTPYILWSIYGLTTFVFLIRFGKNIWKLVSKSKSNPIVKYKNAKLILVDEKTLPHTFLNAIFINFNDYNNRNIEDELYTHELVHVTQKHTLDILFIEFLKTIFWFNPIFILYKKAIQLNHEFLADEEVVESYNNIPFYQSLLLQKINGQQTIYLASNLNYLVTKKRLIMMTKSTSKRIAFLKKVAIIPILAGLVFFICFKVVAQEKSDSVDQTATRAEVMNGHELGNSEADDKKRDSYYSGVWIIASDYSKTNKTDKTDKINKIYEDLTIEEKRKYLSWVPSKIIPREIPESLFEKMKTKKMAVWINGKSSTMAEIKKYSRTDFAHYTYSFVHKNARTKRFPQEYQYTLYTKEYFDKNLKNSHLHFSNDTLKIGMMNYKDALKKQKETKKVKADTLVWVEEIKNGDPDEKIGDKYVNEKGSFDAKGNFLKEGYIKINNKIYFYVTNKQNEIEYYTRWGDKVNKNGEPITSNGNDQQDSPYDVTGLTEKPDFDGGMTAFYNYIAKNFNIPEEIHKNKIKGKVFAQFIIEKDGSLSNIKILRDIGYGTREETERVLKECPKWKPGKMNGTPVRTMYSLPVSITHN